MRSDKVILECKEKLFAVDTSLVASVTEVERLFFLPGGRGLVKGVIALRGEPVTVVDLGEAFGLGQCLKDRKGPHKIVVVKDNGRILGLDIGRGELSFLWGDEIKELHVSSRPERFVSGTIEKKGRLLHMLNWIELYDEAARILSGERQVR